MSVLLMIACSLAGSDATALKEAEMLYPVVRVTTGRGGGSGTILYSEARAKGKCRTFVLTNQHVIDSAIHISKKWSSLLQQDVKQEANDTVRVEIFRYAEGSRQDISDSCRAEIVAHSKEHDLALLELKTARKFTNVAVMLPKDGDVQIFDPIWAVGCSLLHPPIATEGILSYLDDVIDRKIYWMGSSAIIYGNSGGAVFTRKGGHYVFIGIPSRVATTQGQAITFMNWFVPAPRIRSWFKDEQLDFLVLPKKTPKECFAARKTLRKKAESNAAKKGDHNDS